MRLPFKENVKLDVWHRMPASKFLLGKKRVFRLVDRAVADWPVSQLIACRDGSEYSRASSEYAKGIAQKEFGSVMVLLFIGLVTALVQVLLEWWLLGKTYGSEFALWRAELR